MSATPTYAALSDEELLKDVYFSKPVRTPLELELATRLEHALDQLQPTTKTLEQVVNEHTRR